MNLEEVRTFLEVIESGSLVAASRRLNVTQSTVTARINALEDEVGQTLVHRHKSGAELTSAGFKFKRYAEVMVQLWRQARDEVSLPTGFDGVCNLGLEFDLWREIGQRFIDHVHEHCPAVAIAAWPGEQRQLDRWLNTGLIDVAFCFAPQAGENFTSRPLVDDELVLVGDPGAGGAAPGSGYLYVDHGDEFRRQHAAAFPGIATSALTIASSEWALDVLLRKGGSGYLPRRHVAPYLADGRLLVRADAPVLRRRVYVVESTAAVTAWPWYADALAAASGAPGPARAPPPGH